MIELLVQERWLLLLVACVMGALIGSFLNVVVYRMPLMMERAWEDEIAVAQDKAPVERPRFNLVLPRSRCGGCGHAITALENIPVISWLALRGKCSACGIRISARYPLVEIVTALLFFACAWVFGATLQSVAGMTLCAVLVALTGIDLDTQLLPDQLTLPLLWLGLLLNMGQLFARLPDAVLGAAAGYLALWSVYWLFKLVTGREGMGYGDFNGKASTPSSLSVGVMEALESRWRATGMPALLTGGCRKPKSERAPSRDLAGPSPDCLAQVAQ